MLEKFFPVGEEKLIPAMARKFGQPDPSVCAAIDYQNTLVPMIGSAQDHDGTMVRGRVRVEVDNLMRLVLADRDLDKSLCAGIDLHPPVIERFAAHGVSCKSLQRTASGREQGADESLQLFMHQLAAQHPPGTLVLVTGDGAGFEDGTGFAAVVRWMRKCGWLVEVLSWSGATSRHLRAQADVHVALDDYFQSICFIEGGRRAEPLSLVPRRVARRPGVHGGGEDAA